uniref:FRAS1 related extracellular matrix 2a n=1 Tax=Eptatretus burgeri TaxID=7764 RepID=A0A8C4NEW7_EPTBU
MRTYMTSCVIFMSRCVLLITLTTALWDSQPPHGVQAWYRHPSEPYYSQRSRPTTDSILRANTGIRVSAGRSVFLDPVKDLVVRVPAGDHCTITVLDNDPLSQKPGILIPKHFNCEFGPDEVKYQHVGWHSPEKDCVKLQLRYDTRDHTTIIPFTLDVTVEFSQLEVVTKTALLNVPTLLGKSDPINGNILNFAFNRDEICKLSILAGSGWLPRYGTLVYPSDANRHIMSCDEFMNAGIYYEHTAKTSSPDRDYIPMMVHVMDKEGKFSKEEYFQITVRIHGGTKNTPPKLRFDTLMMLEVDQFVMTAITPDKLAAEDAETDPDNLIFNITSQMTREQGSIVSTDDRNLPITAFYQRDIIDLKIAYKPPAVESYIERIYQIEIRIIDSEEAMSEPFIFMIVVKPINTLAPVVTKNKGQMLFEGQSRPLSSVHNLQIGDQDNLQDVQIRVIDGLRHGELTIFGAERKFFTPDDLDSALVVYQHDGSDTYSDNIIFRMTDGLHEVEFLFPITVAPTDDEPPVIYANHGLTIDENGIALISQFVISATDIDSDDSTILFFLEEPLSKIGKLIFQQFEKPIDPFVWKFIKSEGVYERVVTEWFQKDIMDGKLYYKHVGPHSATPIIDQFVFRVQDDNDPPNRSGVQRFLINVKPVDHLPPKPSAEATLHMTVQEYTMTRFYRKLLCYIDEDTSDRDLKFTILHPPVDTDENNPVPMGNLVLTENPDIVVNEFTQAQINHLKISYKPPDVELGITPHVVQFNFTVQDLANHFVLGKFTIFLQPVNNKPPTITNTGFTIFERGRFVLSNVELNALDTDTSSDDISFTLRQVPRHGVLQNFGTEMLTGQQFDLSDVANGRIVYIHNGDKSTKDSININVSDGIHEVPIITRITVKTVDDETPRLNVHDSIGTLEVSTSVLENGETQITSGLIQGTDERTDDLKLIFIVNEKPQHGIIQVNGKQADMFSQRDVIDGVVLYSHNNIEIGMQVQKDTFKLVLSDKSEEFIVGRRKIESVQFRVSILPVDSIAPELQIKGTFLVKEGEKSKITLNHVTAKDVDTRHDEIHCTILEQPTNGYLENISPGLGSERSRVGLPISSFLMKDIRLEHINYVQSIHKGVEPSEDQFTIRCSDGINFSPRHKFPIEIIPSNDELPEIFTKKLIVQEGMMLIINNSTLIAKDDDVPADELHFHVVKPPSHGRIVQQIPMGNILVNSFSFQQIGGNFIIMYEHDDSESKHDHLLLQLTDGKHIVEKNVSIKVVASDDETPRMAINNGLDVEIGETKVITNKILKATDFDSEDKDLMYVIKFGPTQGVLQRQGQNGILVNISTSMTFTQDEIDKKLIQYVHRGQERIRDIIKFDITDGLNPLIDRYFYVTIGSIDNVHPDIINKGVSLKEGGLVTLTTDILSTSDINSPDEHLRFRITRPPSRGHLESTDSPGVSITSFTQLQLAGNKIYYIHTSDDEVKMDSFEFEVTDGFNPVFRTFRISISDLDNKKPVVTINELVLSEGENKIITPFELMVEDQDTPDPLLQFTITQVPIHGKLQNGESQIVNVFTKQDLNENAISYKHDGSETTADSFSFTVTDGTHTDFFVFPDTVLETRKPQTMHIKIIPVDNGIPQVLVNKGAPSLRAFLSGHIGFMLTNKVLKAEDRDSPNQSLLFHITEAPQHGIIINLNLGNNSISSFKQGDVDDLRICYILHDPSNATRDVFYFTVEDAGGNIQQQQPFLLTWAWISIEHNYYHVEEKDKSLTITLRRRGYLGETSFVSISTHDDTARKGEDFKGKPQKQVQFNPGQTTASWSVDIISDGVFERSEMFRIVLSQPILAVLENPQVTVIEIFDPSDESTVFIPKEEYVVDENIGRFLIPIRRSGDVSEELMVICFTEQGSAMGTVPQTVLSFSDYISRAEDHTSVLNFERGDSEQPCPVLIIDDSLYEMEEVFNVSLGVLMGGRLGGTFPSTRIIITPDTNDEPSFYFGESKYTVEENAGSFEVRVWRTGTDLTQEASVTVRSRKVRPMSAEAGVDYVGISQILDFQPGVTMQSLHITILDDLGQPVLEGPERFELVLRMPVNAVLGEPSTISVLINDSFSDREFFERVTIIKHLTKGRVQLLMTRPCVSRLQFSPTGETEKACVLLLVDDSTYEDEEELQLMLGSPKSDSSFGASIGKQNKTLVKIKDGADKPIIIFGETKFSVHEPSRDGDTLLRIPVLRHGDTSQLSVVRVHTKDGSANSGSDYIPISEEIAFRAGETEHFVEVRILYDGEREMREAFSVHLRPDKHMVAETRKSKVTVYIEEVESMADVTFPSVPEVISLMFYDDAIKATEQPNPPAGYPLICITACNPKYTNYAKTGSICDDEQINNTLTLYRWLVSAPTGADGVTSPLREVDSDTFFTSTKLISLDSIYFAPGSRVQCAACAINMNGHKGLELLSPVISVSLCQPRIAGAVGAEPFTARLRYTGRDAPHHSNLIKLTITMPHIDGMLPVISTRPLSNFELTLSPDGTRVASHSCSNIVSHNELRTRYGFLTEAKMNPEAVGETVPYQYGTALRSATTLNFYRNLNLDACLWQFISYYDMSELLTECGGSIGTDGQVLNLVQSYVTLRVPLYVSYVFHSPAAIGGWQHFDLRSDMRLTFVYDTAILWQDGIGSPPEAELQGALYPTSMRINKEGRLVVNFRTEARFHGLFVTSHPGTSAQAMVFCEDHSSLTFTLHIIHSERTFNQPEQQWSFISDFAVRDYSGAYTVRLIPCTPAPSRSYSWPVVCEPHELLTFNLDIRFQQVSDPVAAKFSLNTQIFLLKNKALWLSNGSMGFGEGTDTAFDKGSIIYGRVMVDPVQNLGNSFICNIEKVFLCTGADGYVPKYNPLGREYGCLANTPSLLHHFKILDKAQPEMQTTTFWSIPFHAHFASDVPDAKPLIQQTGSDGFQMDSTSLFQVEAGREWYIHAVYTMRAHSAASRGIDKRSLDNIHHSVAVAGGHVRAPRDYLGDTVPQEVQYIGVEDQRGTNMQHVMLERSIRKGSDGQEISFPFDGISKILPAEQQPSEAIGTSILVAVALLILAIVVTMVTAVVIRQQRRRQNAMGGHVKTRRADQSKPVPIRPHITVDSTEV